MDSKISEAIIKIGIPINTKGFKFLCDAVKLLKQDQIPLQEVYSIIGENYNSSSENVEIAIRHVIEIAWVKNKLSTKKPSIMKFMLIVLDEIINE